MDEVTLKVKKLLKNEFKIYEKELMEIFKENHFKNGGMLYSDDFLINSDFIIVAEINEKIVGYMAIAKLTEEELDRKYEIYQEEPILENSILIKHLVVSEECRRQHIATKLFEYLKTYAISNKIEYLYLWTTLDNNIALDLYKKQDFYKMGDFYPADGTFNGLKDFHSIMMYCHINEMRLNISEGN